MIKLDATFWSVRGELMVAFFPPGPIADDVWRDACDTIASGEVNRVLVASVGALELDALQRRALAEALRTHPRVAIAVVTDEALVRGLMTATTWLGRIDIRTFPWHRLHDAFRHLAPRDVEERAALNLLDAVRRRAER